MSDFSQFVTKDSIVSLNGGNKLDVMDLLIDRAASLSKLDRDEIFRLVWKREQVMTTGLGGKFALPHIRIADITHPFIVIGVSDSGIAEYQSLDGIPIQVVVFLVASDEDEDEYILLLSNISRKFRDGKLVDALLAAHPDVDKLYELITK